MTWVFQNTKELADFFESQAKLAEKSTNKEGVNRIVKAQKQGEAYAYSQAAFIINNCVIGKAK